MLRSISLFLLIIPFWVNGQVKSLASAMQAPLDVVHLKLKRDRLAEFPPEILSLKNLEILDLSNNRLTKLPEEIVELENLQKIILSKNDFTEFPLVLIEMEKLVYIDLWDNYIEHLPMEVKRKNNLTFLDIRGVLLMPEVYEELSTWFSEDILKISPPCDCMYK